LAINSVADQHQSKFSSGDDVMTDTHRLTMELGSEDIRPGDIVTDDAFPGKLFKVTDFRVSDFAVRRLIGLRSISRSESIQ